MTLRSYHFPAPLEHLFLLNVSFMRKRERLSQIQQQCTFIGLVFARLVQKRISLLLLSPSSSFYPATTELFFNYLFQLNILMIQNTQQILLLSYENVFCFVK